MLSRAAASLFWLGRHVERADFTARLMDAAYRFEALPQHDPNSGWKSAVRSSGSGPLFDERGLTANHDTVSEFLALDAGNPSSIRSCIDKARFDARIVRASLTSEAFETLNQCWMEMQDWLRRGESVDMQTLIERIKLEVPNFEGAIWRTLMRGENFWFIRLGTVIERADNTARLLDVKYHTLLPEGEDVGGALDQAQWTAVLRSVSAVTAYRHAYRQTLKPWLIADLLILREDIPRSLAHCMDVASEYMQDLRARHGRVGPADRLARKLSDRLGHLDIDTIYKDGLHEFLQTFIAENNRLSREIGRQFSF